MSAATGFDPESRSLAVGVLCSRLEPTDLRAVLKAEQRNARRRKSVEWIVAETETTGGRLRSRLPDEDLAGFLLDLLGPDLLSSRELRFRLALNASPDELDQLHDYPSQCRGRRGRRSQATAIADRHWRAGKIWATHFARTLGIPVVFSGQPGASAEPDHIDVEPFRPLPPLEDFQEEIKSQLMELLDGLPSENRGILSLPTGAGKTRTAVEGLLEWRLAREGRPAILWIAQSDELCEQAVQAFREVWIDQGHRPTASREVLSVDRLWGSARAVPGQSDVVVASIQKLHAILRGENGLGALSLLAQRLGAVLVDEAHRLLAPSYTEVLRALGIEMVRGSRASVPLIGLTATPYRGMEEETRHLTQRFYGRLLRASCLGEEPVAELRTRGVLSRPMHMVIQHNGPVHAQNEIARFQEYFERFNDFHPHLLRRLGQERARNRRLVEILCELPPEYPTLFFGCSVEHAKAVAVLLRRRGRAAETVTSETRSATRRFLIEEFRSGQISVLCNYGVLTTGFDAPRVRVVVVARPTTSPVLYEQMIGRGMRGPRFGGTNRCLVVDVEDNIHFAGQMAYQRYAEYWVSEPHNLHVADIS